MGCAAGWLGPPRCAAVLARGPYLQARLASRGSRRGRRAGRVPPRLPPHPRFCTSRRPTPAPASLPAQPPPHCIAPPIRPTPTPTSPLSPRRRAAAAARHHDLRPSAAGAPGQHRPPRSLHKTGRQHRRARRVGGLPAVPRPRLLHAPRGVAGAGQRRRPGGAQPAGVCCARVCVCVCVCVFVYVFRTGSWQSPRAPRASHPTWPLVGPKGSHPTAPPCPPASPGHAGSGGLDRLQLRGGMHTRHIRAVRARGGGAGGRCGAAAASRRPFACLPPPAFLSVLCAPIHLCVCARLPPRPAHLMPPSTLPAFLSVLPPLPPSPQHSPPSTSPLPLPAHRPSRPSCPSLALPSSQAPTTPSSSSPLGAWPAFTRMQSPCCLQTPHGSAPMRPRDWTGWRRSRQASARCVPATRPPSRVFRGRLLRRRRRRGRVVCVTAGAAGRPVVGFGRRG